MEPGGAVVVATLLVRWHEPLPWHPGEEIRLPFLFSAGIWCAIVLGVGFWKHGFHFLSLFVPHGAPGWLMPVIIPVEFVSFMVRPFSLGLRLFVAMTAGHILLEVFGSFAVQGLNAGGHNGSAIGFVVWIASFVMIVGVSALELLVCAIQAYVFALLTSLYLHDAVHLH